MKIKLPKHTVLNTNNKITYVQYLIAGQQAPGLILHTCLYTHYLEYTAKDHIARVHNFRGRGECPTVYTAAKHTALSYDAIRY